MEAEETVPQLTGKELRKQKLMEYLEAKGRLKPLNPKPYLRDNAKTRIVSTVKADLPNEKENLAMGKDNHGPKTLKMKRQTVVAHPAAPKAVFQATRTLCCKTNKQHITISSTLCPLSAASITTRLNTLKGATKPLVNSQPASLKTVTVRPHFTIPVKTCPGTTNQPRPKSNSSVKVSCVHPVGSVHPNMTKKLPITAAGTRPSAAAGTRPSAAKTKIGLHSSQVASRNTQLNSNLNRAHSSKVVPVPAVTQKLFSTQKTTNHVTIMSKTNLRGGDNKKSLALSRPGGPAIARTWKPVHRASTGQAGRDWQAKAFSRAMHEAVVKIGQKGSGEDSLEMVTDTKTNTPACWSNRSNMNSEWIPPTVTCSVKGSSNRQVELCWEAGVGLKTPRDHAKVMPQTEGRKKMTAAQEERMQKLQEWREKRGISYKRPPMPIKPLQTRRTVALPQPWASMEDDDIEARSLVSAVDTCLGECIKMLDEGCPSAQLQEMLSRMPMAERFSKYWICQARLMERTGNLDVLPLFEEAVRVVLEPVDELRAVVFEMLKKKEEKQGQNPVALEEIAEHRVQLDSAPDPMATPTAVKALIHGDRGGSSLVKYKITATPGGFRSQQREQGVARMVDGQELRFFTPVRRSVRIEGSAVRYPTSLRDHDLCVASFNDLMAQEETLVEEKKEETEGNLEGGGSTKPAPNAHLYVYRENEALRDQVNIQLVYEEEH